MRKRRRVRTRDLNQHDREDLRQHVALAKLKAGCRQNPKITETVAKRATADWIKAFCRQRRLTGANIRIDKANLTVKPSTLLESLEHVQSLLAQLTPSQRAAMHLIALLDLPMGEAARELDITIATMRRSVKDARRTLRRNVP